MNRLIRMELVRLAGRHGIGFRVNGGEVYALIDTHSHGISLVLITLKLEGLGDRAKYAHVHLAAMNLLSDPCVFADIEQEALDNGGVITSVEVSSEPPSKLETTLDDPNAHLFVPSTPPSTAEA